MSPTCYGAFLPHNLASRCNIHTPFERIPFRMPLRSRITHGLMISTLWLCVIVQWVYASPVPNTTASNKVGKTNLPNTNDALLLNVAELRNELSHIFDTNKFSTKIKQLIPDRPRPPRTFSPHLGALFSFQNSPSLSLNYELANRFCAAKGAYLFFPSNSAELDLLKSKFLPDVEVWIDLRRNSNFSFSLNVIKCCRNHSSFCYMQMVQMTNLELN